MRFPKLRDVMISLSEFKKEVSNLIEKKATKIIVKNNEPVAVMMSYDDYEDLLSGHKTPGETFILSNGVKVKIVVTEENEEIVTKTYIQMKNSDEFKLFFTHGMTIPKVEQTLTPEELVASYEIGEDKNDLFKIFEMDRENKKQE